MRGVASKNLPSYLAWMRMQAWFKDGSRRSTTSRPAWGAA